MRVAPVPRTTVRDSAEALDGLMDGENGVAEGSQLSVDERLMAAIGVSPLDGVPVGLGYAAVLPASTIQEDLDVFLGLELPCEVLAQAVLIARDDEIVSSHVCHTPILYETRARVKVGGAAPGPVGPFALSWKDDGGCRAFLAPARRRNHPSNRRPETFPERRALPEIARPSERHCRPGAPRPGSSGRS